MKPKEKNEIMEKFSANEIQVLVSTTVVEVGVNVPHATVMMVENAERLLRAHSRPHLPFRPCVLRYLPA